VAEEVSKLALRLSLKNFFSSLHEFCV
jgi:hypothetical protein